MNIEKYKDLRDQIKNKSFEKKYLSVDKILYYSSFFGNIGSIFFAFFLWFPSLLKTINLHIGENILTYLIAVTTTIILLSLVELLKRGVLKIFSSEFIEENMSFGNRSVYGLFFFSFFIVGLSFYFSINGAVEFSKTSGKNNIVIENNNKIVIDSLIRMNERSKEPINQELSSLRLSNQQLRDKRDNTPIELRRARNEYNSLILDNEKLIESNVKKLNDLEKSTKTKILELKNDEVLVKTKNEESDKDNILLFLVVSSFIEIIIVIGVYFREYYTHKSFYESELKLEPILKKREKYSILLKLIYKNGDLMQDEMVISFNKLSEIVKNRGASYTRKHVKDFYDEMTHLGVFKMVSNKRYASVSYNDAQKLLETIENV